tara:strand:+ start:74 stop:271 length:198 start_codon:yes stop_codon:yes gene_type:complete
MSDEVPGTIKYKITSDLVLDLYEASRDMEGKQKEETLEKVKLLSQRIGDYIVQLDEPTKPEKDEQ